MRACRPSWWRRTPRRCASSGGSPFPEVLDVGRIGIELTRAQLFARRLRQAGVVPEVALELLVLEVLITSCQVSLKPKNGPLAAHSTTAPQAARNATGRPVHTASLRAKSEKRNRAISSEEHTS